MKPTTIKFSDLQACPARILSAEHWIPEHKIEECDLKLISKVKAKERELAGRLMSPHDRALELKEFKEALRRGK